MIMVGTHPRRAISEAAAPSDNEAEIISAFHLMLTRRGKVGAKKKDEDYDRLGYG